MSLHYSAVLAANSDGGIGYGGDIPWRMTKEDRALYKEDMNFFAELTTKEGSVVIMGRHTWDSIPEKFRPFKNRVNVVITSGNLNGAGGVILATSLPNALKVLAEKGDIKHVFVIGGAKLYQEAFNSPLCDRVYLTTIIKNYQTDVKVDLSVLRTPEFRVQDHRAFYDDKGVPYITLETYVRAS